MDEKSQILKSSALQVNLERTAAKVAIPDRYGPLLKVVESHYGVSLRTHDLLLELNHPYVNWEYVLKELRTLSIGDFYEINMHDEGLGALEMILRIYFDIIGSAPEEAIRDTAIRYLFDYVVTIIDKSGELLGRNIGLLPLLAESLKNAYHTNAPLFRKCSTYAKTLLRAASETCPGTPLHALQAMLYDFFRETYRFWLTQPDPAAWADSVVGDEEATHVFHGLVYPLTHKNLLLLLAQLENVRTLVSSTGQVTPYLALPDHSQIVNAYFLIANEIERYGVFKGRQHIVKLDFLSNMMTVPGLSDMHYDLLRDINRCLRLVLKEEDEEHLTDLVRNIFTLLKKSTSPQYSGAVIECIATLAKEIFERRRHPLVDVMIEELIRFGFQHPEVAGSTTDWQVRVNPSHITNIRSWLGIIALRPRWAKRLLSALVINLKVGGVFVRDTDLLQKDISGLLNTDIQPAYNLVKQLLRIFPIYFTEIGAEGELRDTSTRLDELSLKEGHGRSLPPKAVPRREQQPACYLRGRYIPFLANGRQGVHQGPSPPGGFRSGRRYGRLLRWRSRNIYRPVPQDTQ